MNNLKNIITTENYISEIDRDTRYNAYGNFLDRFRNCLSNDEREVVISKRPINDDKYPIDVSKLTAAVERLCNDYNLTIPKWVTDEKYILKDPYYGNVKNEDYKKLLRDTSLPEFKKRNLFLGDNCMERA